MLSDKQVIEVAFDLTYQLINHDLMPEAYSLTDLEDVVEQMMLNVRLCYLSMELKGVLDIDEEN